MQKNTVSALRRERIIVRKNRREKHKQNKILSYDRLQVSIPRKFLLRCYYKNDFLTEKETIKTYRKLRELEKKSYQIRHALDIVGKILLKEWKEVKYKERSLTQYP